MKTRRLFLFLLLALVAVWIYAVVDSSMQESKEREYYQQHVLPYVTKPGSGQTPATDPLAEWKRLSRRTADSAQFMLGMTVTCVGLFIGWAGFEVIRNEIYQRRRQAPNRPADPGAGAQLAALERSGGQLTARWTGGGWAFPHYVGDEVAVDFHRGIVTFRGFIFLTGIVGNHRTTRTEVPFSELLGSRMRVDRGRFMLQLRTTKGRVYLTDSLQPFAPLVAVLNDAIEVNRRSPQAYRSALAREPDSSTPWYAWLGIVGAGVVIFSVMWWAYS